MKECNYNLRFLLLSSIGAFVFASIFHFVYELFKIPIIGVIFPINESIWEHLKLCFYPTILIWMLPWGEFYPRWHKKEAWFLPQLTGAAISISFSSCFVLSWYYTLLAGFQLSGIWVDLGLLFIGIFIGQCLGLHIVNHGSGKCRFCSIIYLLIIAGVFGYFTFYPPNLPVFISPQ